MINDWYKKYTWNLSWSINIYWLIIYNPSCSFFCSIPCICFNKFLLSIFVYVKYFLSLFTELFFCSISFFKVLPVFMNVQYFLYLYTVQYYIVPVMQYTIDLSAAHHWFVCSTLLVCLQYIIDLSAVHHWFVCSALLICLQYTIDLSAVHHWFVCSTPFICLQYFLYLFTILKNCKIKL